MLKKTNNDSRRLRSRLLRTGNILMILLFFMSMNVSARADAQTISLSFKNAPLEKVIKEIEKQSGYNFVYNVRILDNLKKVSVQLKNVSLEKALNSCFDKKVITYEISKKTIVLTTIPNTTKTTSYDNTIQFARLPVEINVTGTVRDSLGNPLESAVIAVKGTNQSAVTNAKGEFSITVREDATLIVSLTGYNTKEVNVGNNENITIVLSAKPKEVEQVVVTALGIKRTTKALSYNIQEVKGDEVTKNKDANFMNSLVGKVAGVTINSSSAGIGGGVRVVMRGIKSLTGNNNALYVIDGVPLQSLTSGQPSDIFGGNTGSDGISNINPDDIESISVLTGAAGSALYGSLGLNGVVIINTKSGKKGQLQVNLSNNTSFFSPFVLPEFQNTYGPSSSGSYYSWGEKLSKPSTYKPKDFFQTGYNTTTAINLSTGSEKSQTYASAAMVKGQGILPNNDLKRYNFTIRNTSSFLDDKLNLDLNAQYIYQSEQNMIAQGLYFNPLVPLYLFPPGDDFSKYQDYERYDPSRLLNTQFWPYGVQGSFQMQNPYWVVNRNLFEVNKDRFLLGASLKYNIASGVSATGRVKYDYNLTNNQTRLYASTIGLLSGPGGRYANINTASKQIYSDFIVNINKTIHNDFRIDANIGIADMENKINGSGFDGNIATGSTPNLFSLSNISLLDANQKQNIFPTETNGPITAMRSTFATAEASYKSMLFVNASYRFDWWSQLYGSTSKYFTYPSVGVSAILSDMLKMHSDAVTYIKLRGSYAEVGNPPSPYLANDVITYPLTNGQASNNPRYPTNTLKPERTQSYEAGLSMRFLKNRISLDVTVYKTNTKDQIFQVIPSGATGSTALYFNSGQVTNKGIEATLGYNGNIGNVKWESNATFTLNRNKIIRLLDNFYDQRTNTFITMDTLLVASTGSYAQYLIKGGSAGDIYTSTLLRDVDRRKDYILDGSNTVVPDPTRFVKAGTANPKYQIGFRNGITYKGINFSFLVAARIGGEVVSATQAIMDGFGVSKTSAEARDRGYVMINGQQNTGIANYYSVVGGGTNGVLSQYVYSATNVRLREASIGYSFSNKLLKTKFIKEIYCAFTAQNLFMFYNKAPFDPENTASTSTYFQGIDYFMQPSLRSLGFNVRVKF